MPNRLNGDYWDYMCNWFDGCTHVSEGCDHCWAESLASSPAFQLNPRYQKIAVRFDGEPRWTHKINFNVKPIEKLIAKRTPLIVAHNFMSDTFHPDTMDVPGCTPEARQLNIARVNLLSMLHYNTPNNGRQHTHLFLTKRPENIYPFIVWLLDNDCEHLIEFMKKHIWLGITAENQQRFDERLPYAAKLARLGFRVWWSLEPLLGPITFKEWPLDPNSTMGEWSDLDLFHLIVLGGESGPHARPMLPDWAMSIRDECADAGVPFWFKQWGEFLPVAPVYHMDDPIYDERLESYDDSKSTVLDISGISWPEFQPPPGSWIMERVGKRRAGRVLDGVIHNGWPN